MEGICELSSENGRREVFRYLARAEEMLEMHFRAFCLDQIERKGTLHFRPQKKPNLLGGFFRCPTEKIGRKYRCWGLAED